MYKPDTPGAEDAEQDMVSQSADLELAASALSEVAIGSNEEDHLGLLIGAFGSDESTAGSEQSDNRENLLDVVRNILVLPEAVTLCAPEEVNSLERFLHLASPDERWGFRVEAVDRRGASKKPDILADQEIEIYALNYEWGFLAFSSLESNSEHWSVWGVKARLEQKYFDAWRNGARPWFLLPDSLELGGEWNYKNLAEGQQRETVRKKVIELLAQAQPDTELTSTIRDYWVDRGRMVVPFEASDNSTTSFLQQALPVKSD